MRPTDYPNIIFDLGGVILNIDYQLTIDAFKKIGLKDFDVRYSQLQQSELFNQFERGEMTSRDFRAGLRAQFETGISDEDIDTAWNAMLLDLPLERVVLIRELSKTKRIVLLSNTNQIHVESIESALSDDNMLGDFNGLFLKKYYSFEVGMRKPEKRIFDKVISEMNFNPSETLFIDDSPQHIEGAKAAGLNAVLLEVNKGQTLLDLF
jgi:putative hydrolase of the HAD superfamily